MSVDIRKFEVGGDVVSIGLVFESVSPMNPVVSKVVQYSWADLQGVMPGDKLITIAGRDVSQMLEDEFKVAMTARPLVMKMERRSEDDAILSPKCKDDSSATSERSDRCSDTTDHNSPCPSSVSTGIDTQIANATCRKDLTEEFLPDNFHSPRKQPSGFQRIASYLGVDCCVSRREPKTP
jgi:hypothetical protein